MSKNYNQKNHPNLSDTQNILKNKSIFQCFFCKIATNSIHKDSDGLQRDTHTPTDRLPNARQSTKQRTFEIQKMAAKPRL